MVAVVVCLLCCVWVVCCSHLFVSELFAVVICHFVSGLVMLTCCWPPLMRLGQGCCQTYLGPSLAGALCCGVTSVVVFFIEICLTCLNLLCSLSLFDIVQMPFSSSVSAAQRRLDDSCFRWVYTYFCLTVGVSRTQTLALYMCASAVTQTLALYMCVSAVTQTPHKDATHSQLISGYRKICIIYCIAFCLSPCFNLIEATDFLAQLLECSQDLCISLTAS